jgi:hypothetical protein
LDERRCGKRCVEQVSAVCHSSRRPDDDRPVFPARLTRRGVGRRKEDRPYCPSIGARPVQLTVTPAILPEWEVADIRRGAQGVEMNSAKTLPGRNGKRKAPSRVPWSGAHRQFRLVPSHAGLMYKVVHLVAIHHVGAAWPVGDQLARARLFKPCPRSTARAEVTLGWCHWLLRSLLIHATIVSVFREERAVPSSRHRRTLNSPTATSVTGNVAPSAMHVNRPCR